MQGGHYLLQLAGDCAVERKPPPHLSFIENSNFGVQRGGVVLHEPQPHVMHTMIVRFHRQ